MPPLTDATPTQIAEAIRIGPYLMPRFAPALLNDRKVASIARFVVAARHPHSPGGAGIGYIGPVPEGMVTWLAALPVLLLVTRLIGRRERSSADAREIRCPPGRSSPSPEHPRRIASTRGVPAVARTHELEHLSLRRLLVACLCGRREPRSSSPTS